MSKYKQKCSVFCSQSIPYIDETNFDALGCKELFINDKNGKQRKLGIYCEQSCDLLKQVVYTKGESIKTDENWPLALFDNMSGVFEGFLLSVDDNDEYDNSSIEDDALFNTPQKKNKRKMVINIGKYSIVDNIGQITPSNIFRLSKNVINNKEDKQIKNVNDAQLLLKERSKYLPKIFKFESADHSDEYLRFLMPYYIKINNEYINKSDNTLILSEDKNTPWMLVPTEEEIFKRRNKNKSKLTKKVRMGSKFVLCTFPYKMGEGQFLRWDGSGNFSFVIKRDNGSIFSIPFDIDAKSKCTDCIFIPHEDKDDDSSKNYSKFLNRKDFYDYDNSSISSQDMPKVNNNIAKTIQKKRKMDLNRENTYSSPNLNSRNKRNQNIESNNKENGIIDKVKEDAEKIEEKVEGAEGYLIKYKKPLIIGGIILASSVIIGILYKVIKERKSKESKSNCSPKTFVSIKSKSMPKSFPDQLLYTPIPTRK